MQEKEICWNITTKCNQNCRYCHRFLNIADLDIEENKKILMKLIRDNITDITWTGGEALLYPGLSELLKIAHENGIRNKLITNGIVLAGNEKMKSIYQYLDSLTLSIDSVSDKINKEIGRGEEHYKNIKQILEYLKGRNLNTTINTVLSQKNIQNIQELGEFLSQYDITAWRVFKFMPLRETAQINKEEFEITDDQFERSKQIFRKFTKISKIEFRTEQDMEDKYVLIVANGDIIQTQDGKDVKKGNARYKNLTEFIESKMIKMKLLELKDNASNLVIVGNIAYDILDFSHLKTKRESIVDIGGACVFTSIPASQFSRVGIVGKIGKDFDISKFYGYNIDLSAIQSIDTPTTRFYTIWNSEDGQERTVIGEVAKEMEVGANDIPKKFLGAKHFHLTTATPEKQLELIHFLRTNTNATISVDTIDEFARQPKCREVFDNVDIAFVDKEYTNLLNCKAPIKIIKCGKKGCIYYSKEKKFPVYSKIVADENVVDKTGAGDCLNGVFLNLINNGVKEEQALKIAVDTATESIKQKGIMNFRLPRLNNKEEREV